MRLYDLDHSPFAARVRMALYAKGLTAATAMPPGGARSNAYRAINPLGLVPALMLDDGAVITESLVICRYLDEIGVGPSLFGASARDRARMRAMRPRTTRLAALLASLPRGAGSHSACAVPKQ